MERWIKVLLSVCAFILALITIIGLSGCGFSTEPNNLKKEENFIAHICDHSGKSYDIEIEGYTTFDYSTIRLDLKDGTKIYTSIENCIIFKGECLLCKSED